MPYFYNVIIARKSNPSEDVVKLDLLEAELQERILAPYYEGTTIVIRGIQIDPTDIEQMRIYVTEAHSDVVRPRVAQEFRDSGVIFAGSIEPYVAQRGEDVTDDYITSPPGSRPRFRYRDDPKPTQDSGPMREAPVPDPKKVFVVHGRNSKVKNALFHFLRSIGLIPIEWSQARRLTGKPQPYIGAILDTAFSTAQAVVVLMTPDDKAKLKEEFRQDNDPPYERELTGQSRPNVLFEAGMAMGWKPDNTILIELGDLRPFSDIAGLHILRLNDSSPRRQELAQRLESAGCEIDLTGTEWHSAGDFTV